MSNSASHIVILCSRLDSPGGIEKAITQAANLFARKGHSVTLLVLDETNKTFFPLDPAVSITQSAMTFGITGRGNIVTRKAALLKNVLQLRKILKDLSPSVVIGTEYPFSIAATLCGIRKKAKLIAWEHHHFHELKRSYFWEKLLQLSYPRLHAVAVLNEEEKKLFSSLNKNIIVIPNFINSGKQSELLNKKILTVGRLTAVKGTDLLMKTAKILFKRHPDWIWEVIGTGDMEQQLNSFIKTSNLEKNIHVFTPVSPALESVYNDCSIYVCCSRHESFGMTIIEAMATGLLTISFDCPTGPRHIITHNNDGLLVDAESPLKLSEAISLAIREPGKRKLMGINAYNTAKNFSEENAWVGWKKLFES